MKLNQRQQLLTMLASTVIALITVWSLVELSEVMIHRRNSFVRLFPTYPVTAVDTTDLNYNSFYIAGTSGGLVHFGSRSGPLHVLSLDVNTGDTTHSRVTIAGIDTMKFWGLSMKVDSPFYYLMDGTKPTIFRGLTDNWNGQLYNDVHAYFTEAVPISSSSFGLRSKHSGTKEFVLGKLATGGDVTLSQSLLQKQIDGVFCTDGKLHFSRELKRLIYIYFYRNEFIVADSNLRLDYRGRTIDTVRLAKIRVARTSQGVSLSAPPVTINKSTCVMGRFLFVHSGSLAKNENEELFIKSATIDVYDIASSGRYIFSFHLPRYEGKNLTDFLMTGDQVIALFETTVVRFSFRTKYLTL